MSPDGDLLSYRVCVQMQRRQTYDKLPLQANVYPMPAAMFLQDADTRFSVLTAQALGVFVMQPGQSVTT